MTHQGTIFHDLNIFVGDDMGKVGPSVYNRLLKEDAVADHGALFHHHTGGEDAVLHAAFDAAAVRDQRVDALAVGADIGGGLIPGLGADGALGAEQVCADAALQQLHGAVIILLNGVDLGGKALPDVHLEVQGVLLGPQHIAAEGEEVLGVALIDQILEQLGGQDVHIQAAVASGSVDLVEDVGNAAVLVLFEIAAVVGTEAVIAAHHGDVRAGGDVFFIDLLQGEVGHQVAVHQGHIVLADGIQIGADALQGFHLTAEGQGSPILLIVEGRQDLEAAMLTGKIPILTGAQVVQQGLVLAVKDHTHVSGAGVHQVGQGKVHSAVTAAYGDGCAGADLPQFLQVVASLIGENDTVKTFHFLLTSLPLRSSMMPGRTVWSAAISLLGARTVRPQVS